MIAHIVPATMPGDNPVACLIYALAGYGAFVISMSICDWVEVLIYCARGK